MVEKAGHKKRVVAARDEWLHENRPKSTDDMEDEASMPTGSNDRPQTPRPDDVPADDDLFGAAPQIRPPVTGGLIHLNDAPEEDDLDALMAEAEANDRPAAATTTATTAPEEDDLDALIAEAEAGDKGNKNGGPSNTGVGQQTSADYVDEEDAMREMDGMW